MKKSFVSAGDRVLANEWERERGGGIWALSGFARFKNAIHKVFERNESCDISVVWSYLLFGEKVAMHKMNSENWLAAIINLILVLWCMHEWLEQCYVSVSYSVQCISQRPIWKLNNSCIKWDAIKTANFTI